VQHNKEHTEHIQKIAY